MAHEILTENRCNEEILRHEEVAKKAILVALAAEGIVCDGEISLVFVKDEEMKRLNNEYRNMDYATDVLSFPQLEPHEVSDINKPGNYAALGDIVINLDKAHAQAEEYGHSIEREVAFLTVHSVLHLLGYDHEDDTCDEEIFAKQEDILTSIGLER